MRGLILCLGIVVSHGIACGQATAGIVFDENGQGFFDGKALTFGMGKDPNSGLTTLFYNLPFNVNTGDVYILEPAADAGGQTGVRSDVLRFYAASPASKLPAQVFVFSG